ncbi:MAG: chemotaxis protein CheA [Bacteroidetes bacterium]|nr:chemotaxis protein CheA [Bacteroidota bacterium]MBU1115625.1 chemotaxis protein CheA [Bacteroidota bacterium]MBU1797603.1 chemotaxis protein CheA [Bacteroidota bacterium]
MIDSLQQAFIEETKELLAELEITLLAVEDAPTDSELIAKLFRALHTIKGSSSMFGFDDIALFTHDIETAYDLIRNGKLGVTKHIIDLTLLARDEISNMLVNTGSHTNINEENTKKIIESFREIVSGYNKTEKKQTKDAVELQSSSNNKSSEKHHHFHIRFIPGKDLFLTGTNPLMLIDELREMGSMVLSAHFDKTPDFIMLNPEECYCYWNIFLKTTKTLDDLQDVFIFVADNSELTFENISNEIPKDFEIDFTKLQNIISQNAQNNTNDFRSILKEYFSVQKQEMQSEINAPKKQAQASNGHSEADSVSSIRVSSEKLDELVNLVGELVTIQATLSQVAISNNNNDMISISEEVERITWSLRDSALNIRMLPIGSTFSKFKRLVRDLSNELGKEVELSTDGAATELDKTVIEKLNDPLIHIIRNSIDHGVEAPEERIRVGKSSMGKVHLSASQSGGNVLIKIIDDGAGLNKEAIREKAIKSGIISETTEMNDTELYSLIFAPGFSTAKKVTSVSGRGVGMDVVRRAIEGLRGSVQVSSELGKGTVITLKLPLTLAIIDGLLVKIESDHYVLPLSSIEECIELSEEDIKKAHGRHIVNIRGKIIPYISLREIFSIKTNRPKIEQVVIAKINNHQVGFVVDQVFGQHQTVLKSLGKYYKNVEGISGATILGDGTVALILDINKLTENEEIIENNF